VTGGYRPASGHRAFDSRRRRRWLGFGFGFGFGALDVHLLVSLAGQQDMFLPCLSLTEQHVV